jgi:LCP family protein required for cell wall assembly
MGRHTRSRGRRDLHEISSLGPSSRTRGGDRGVAGSRRSVGTPVLYSRRQRRLRLAIRAVLLLLVGLVVFGAVAAYAWFSGTIGRFVSKDRALNAKVRTVLTKPKPPGAPFYIVLMGEDKRPGEQVGNSDTLMVAYIDPPRKRVSLLSIPRDSRVEIPGYGRKKINAAALLGGPRLTIETVKLLTGLPISHYMVADFNGFKEIVDAIGGVTVNVPATIKDPKAASHDWHAEVIKKGVRKLDGAHALTFVRSRAFANGDITRVHDQQVFLKALAKQTLQLGNLVHVPAITDAVMKNVTTDMTVGDLLGLAADLKGIGDTGVEGATMPGTPKYVGGVAYVIVNKTALAAMVRRMEAGQPLTPKVAKSVSPARAPKR